jgi:hypothetical protein
MGLQWGRPGPDSPLHPRKGGNPGPEDAARPSAFAWLSGTKPPRAANTMTGGMRTQPSPLRALGDSNFDGGESAATPAERWNLPIQAISLGGMPNSF